MRLFIEPAEPLMFRTARPFDAGQNTFAESLFPPTPETLQGAVRAAIAAHWSPHKNIAEAFNDRKLTDLIGDRYGYGRFRMTGITLGRYEKGQSQEAERLLPVPAHIRKTEDRDHLLRLYPHPVKETTKSNWPEGIQYYLTTEQKSDGDLKPVEGWLSETDLLKALGTDDLTGIKTIHKNEVYQEEPRLGIGIQLGTKATEEGYLYQIVMIRMNHRADQQYIYGFIIDIDLAPLTANESPLSDKQIQEALHLPSSGWLMLGGEQRTAHFRVLKSGKKLASVQTKERTLRYLATPASFEQGWQPAELAETTLITAAIDRYEAIGGWLLNPEDARGKNKVMRRCVAAGSVYFFQARKIDTDKKAHTVEINKNQPQPLTDHGKEIGYGITYEGTW